MAYPLQTASVLRAYFNISKEDATQDFSVSLADGVITVDFWNDVKYGPLPSDTVLTDIANDTNPLPASAGPDYSGVNFSEWVLDHGGDVIRTARRSALDAMQDDRDLYRAAIQALMILILDNLKNTSWVGNATPTRAAAWTSLKNKISEILGES